jgi:hypothetical protein
MIDGTKEFAAVSGLEEDGEPRMIDGTKEFAAVEDPTLGDAPVSLESREEAAGAALAAGVEELVVPTKRVATTFAIPSVGIEGPIAEVPHVPDQAASSADLVAASASAAASTSAAGLASATAPASAAASAPASAAAVASSAAASAPSSVAASAAGAGTPSASASSGPGSSPTASTSRPRRQRTTVAPPPPPAPPPGGFSAVARRILSLWDRAALRLGDLHATLHAARHHVVQAIAFSLWRRDELLTARGLAPELERATAAVYQQLATAAPAGADRLLLARLRWLQPLVLRGRAARAAGVPAPRRRLALAVAVAAVVAVLGVAVADALQFHALYERRLHSGARSSPEERPPDHGP